MPAIVALQVIDTALVERMLTTSSGLLFAVKDEELRYQAANDAMVSLCCATTRQSLIGRRAGDFFPVEAEQRYEALDRLVLRTRRPVREVLDLTVRLRGAPVWVIMSRFPIVGIDQRVEGVAIVGKVLEIGKRTGSYRRVMDAIRHTERHIDSRIGVAELAKRAGVSIIQLERDFLRVFGCTPHRYLTKVRLESALPLVEGPLPIAQIAQLCGYSDQSSFARRFKASTGLSPSQYRKLTASGGGTAIPPTSRLSTS